MVGRIAFVANTLLLKSPFFSKLGYTLVAMKVLSIFSIVVLLISSAYKPSATGEPEKMKGMVARHNYWRAKVHVGEVTWSSEVAKVAQEWADHLAKEGCNMKHRPREGRWGTNYGENIYWSQGMDSTPDGVVDDWASEIEYFDESSGKCKGGVCGHYTQLVWKNTARIGCGMAKCGDQEIWVCNYDPPGNWVGQKPY
jgi:uncharacterized protein YkwD